MTHTAHKTLEQPAFLPMTREECCALGWFPLDVIIVTGDAYVDHPAFGAALIGRALVAAGFKTGVIAQPSWNDATSCEALGRPKLFFGVTAGNMDSLVAHYTAQRKLRSDDAYTPGGHAGKRPDRACIIYTQLLRRYMKGVPIVLGGIEASLRRLPHYDFWTDSVRNSVLLDAKADILVYGMGERAICTIAQRLSSGETISSLTDIAGTVTTTKTPDDAEGVMLPAGKDVCTPSSFLAYEQLWRKTYQTSQLYMPHAGRYLIHMPPSTAMTTEELDALYALPFSRMPHPHYAGEEIPAYTQIKDSLTSHRGCYGGCSFCALSVHQGRVIQSRSVSSLVCEAQRLVNSSGFRGHISDVGGPTANMYGTRCGCDNAKSCVRESCLFPHVCAHLITDHAGHLGLLAALRDVPGVEHVSIASGMRHDMIVKDSGYIQALAREYVGGYMKLAPEHTQSEVLRHMRKPSIACYEAFEKAFISTSKAIGRQQYCVPYMIAGHPGTTWDAAIEAGLYVKRRGWKLEQVQEFTPTPMTVSTCMYYTGRDPLSGEAVYVPKGREVKIHKALLQWYKAENKKYIVEAARAAHRREVLDEFFTDGTPSSKKPVARENRQQMRQKGRGRTTPRREVGDVKAVRTRRSRKK